MKDKNLALKILNESLHVHKKACEDILQYSDIHDPKVIKLTEAINKMIDERNEIKKW